MRQFGYRCRNCGETWMLEPASTVTCEWCNAHDPFGGDTCTTRPPLEELAKRYARPSCVIASEADESSSTPTAPSQA